MPSSYHGKKKDYLRSISDTMRRELKSIEWDDVVVVNFRKIRTQVDAALEAMPRTRRPYAPEFRRQMIELVRAGRSPEQLAREFEPAAQSIRNWVEQADRDEGGVLSRFV
jgi:hypothetical protein